MSLSPVAFFGLLDETNPVGTDSRTISDDQHRNILASMKQQAPNWTAAITATHADIDLLAGFVAAGVRPMPGIPLSTICWFYNETPPIGWLVHSLDTERLYLGVAEVLQGTIPGVFGADAMEPTNFPVNITTTITGATAGATAPHTHNVSGTTANNTACGPNGPTGSGVAACAHAHSFNVTSGAATDTTHSHGAGTLTGTGSDTITFNPKRALGVVGRLNVA